MRHATSKSVFSLCSAALFSVGILLSQAHAGLTLYGSAFSSDPFDNNLSNLYNVNPTSGAATLIGNIGYRLVGGLDFDSNGTLYGVGETYTPGSPPFSGPLVLITINTATGAGSTVGNLGVSKNFQDISFRNSDGKLYAYASGELYTINKASGAAALVGTTGEVEIGGALSFSPTDTLLKIGFDHIFTLDQSAGNGTASVQLSYPTAGTPFATGSDFDYATNTLYAAVHTGDSLYSPTYLATIDTSTGTVTKIGDSVIGLTGLAAIPEPSTYGVLAGLVLVGIGIVSVSRRKKVISA